MSSSENGDGDDFDEAYVETPPWDIGRPQPTVRSLFEERSFGESAIDVGCGTGENTLFLATQNYSVLGIDSAPRAIEQARTKARNRNVENHVRFAIRNALTLDELAKKFDVALDCGLFHVFDDENRRKYVEALGHVVAPDGYAIVLCFSDQEPGEWGPRRISTDELQAAFDNGWTVEEIRPVRFAVNPNQNSIDPSNGDSVEAWLAITQRVRG
jgi:SAM-dependent methyltransferase